MTAVVLFGATPARAAITINIDCPSGQSLSWNAPTQTLSCGGSVTPPPPTGAPTGCTLQPSPSTMTAAGPVNLSVSCTGGNPPTGYAWSANGVTFNSGSTGVGTATTPTGSNSATIQATTMFSVVASNEAGTGNQASASVQVGTVAGGLSCPGFSKTLFVNWDWAGSLTTIDTQNTQGGLGTNGILVIPFMPTAPANNVVAQISTTNFPGTHMVNTKRVAISTQPCDLYPSAAYASTQSTTPKLFYVVGVSSYPGATSVTPGVQYYINVAERNNFSSSNPSGTPTCVPGGQGYPNCELRIQFAKPTGH